MRTILQVLGARKKSHIFESVTSFSNPNVLLHNSLDIANEFNKIFVYIVENLMSSAESSDGPNFVDYHRHFSSHIVNQSFFCVPTSPEEVEIIISTLATNKSSSVLKEKKNYFANPCSFIQYQLWNRYFSRFTQNRIGNSFS